MSMEEIKKALAVLSKDAACGISRKELVELFETVDPKELDVTPLELVLTNAFGHGVMWCEAVKEQKEKEIQSQSLNSGIWLVITELAFTGNRNLIEEIIRSVGFSYEECLDLMDQSGCNNDVLEPIVESIFNEEEEEEETEEVNPLWFEDATLIKR